MNAIDEDREDAIQRREEATRVETEAADWTPPALSPMEEAREVAAELSQWLADHDRARGGTHDWLPGVIRLMEHARWAINALLYAYEIHAKGAAARAYATGREDAQREGKAREDTLRNIAEQERAEAFSLRARLEAAETAVDLAAFVLVHRPGDITPGRAYDLALEHLRRYKPTAGYVGRQGHGGLR